MSKVHGQELKLYPYSSNSLEIWNTQIKFLFTSGLNIKCRNDNFWFYGDHHKEKCKKDLQDTDTCCMFSQFLVFLLTWKIIYDWYGILSQTEQITSRQTKTPSFLNSDCLNSTKKKKRHLFQRETFFSKSKCAPYSRQIKNCSHWVFIL